MHRRSRGVLLQATLACALAGCGARSDLDTTATAAVDPAVVVDPPPLVSPWSMRGQGSTNQSRGTSPAILDPVEVWSFQAFGVAPASPAIAADGTLYLHIGYSNTLTAVNPDGTLKWEFAGDPTDGGSQYSSPAIGADGTIYFGSGSHLAAVDPAGHLRWLLPSSGAVGGSPVVAPDGTIDFCDEGAHLYSASPDGVMRWSLTLDGSISLNLDPVVAPDGTVYAGIGDTLFAVVEGSVKWTASFKSGTCCGGRALSIADDGTIVAVARDGVFAFRPDGSTKWAFEVTAPDDEWLGSAAAIAADGTVYVKTIVNSPAVARVLAIGNDGAFKWSVKAGLSQEPWRPTVASDGNVYTTDPVQIIDPNGLITATSIPPAKTSTSIVIGANGTFYTVFGGALHAFGR